MINLSKCPSCNSNLEYDSKIEKYRCSACKKVFSIEPDLTNGKVAIKEWFELELPTPIEGHKYYVTYPDGSKEITENPQVIKDNMFAKHYVDLTQLFGAGNEPKDVETFEAMFPPAYYTYELKKEANY